MFAFVLMPFDEKFDDIYKLGIKETAERIGITAERVDEQIFHKENILERIYNQISIADFIIADVTDRNPNVFYEIGYAHAKGKICLLLTSNVDDIPFDLKHHRHIIYGNSIQNLRQELERELAWIKTEVANRLSVISVELNRTDGILEKTEYSATGKVDLFFDLNNKTNTPSPEIEAIYFYTGPGWKFTQDGQECSSTVADAIDMKLRHFVKPPVRRLNAGGWAQIKLSGRKFLEFAGKGKILKDKYKLSGRSLIRLTTSEGDFDHLIIIDVEVEEFPF
jgi:nucleoside 2-deoxyribosyltransferase